MKAIVALMIVGVCSSVYATGGDTAIASTNSVSALEAFCLLTRPVGGEETLDGFSPAMQRAWMRAITAVAIENEWLDEAELNLVTFRDPSNFGDAVNTIRKRHQELESAPRIAEAGRLPPRSVVLKMLAFNEGYDRALKARLALESDRAGPLAAALAENKLLHEFWQEVSHAQATFFTVPVRRGALQRAIQLLGEEDFYEGLFPPPVPVWRFEVVR